jgi:integrase/recombinase XerD
MSTSTTFEAACEDYFFYIQFERPKPVSKQTLETSKKRLLYLQKYWSEMPVLSLTTRHVFEFKAELIKRGSSPGYIHAYLTLIRSFFRFLKEQRKMMVLDYTDIKLPPQEKNDIEFLSEDELRRFVSAINLGTIHGIRLKAFVALILDTGARINEVISLNRDSINWRDKRAYIVGKGDKKRMLFFQDWSLHWIKTYLSLREDDHEALFVSHKPPNPTARIIDEDMRRFFRSTAKKAGIKRVWPHMLRRTSATHLLFNGEDVRNIQRFLGHSKLAITERYLGTDWSKLQESISSHRTYAGIEDIGRPVHIAWARGLGFPHCQKCRTSERKHAGKGLCMRCYMQEKRSKELTGRSYSPPLNVYEHGQNKAEQGDVPVLEKGHSY